MKRLVDVGEYGLHAWLRQALATTNGSDVLGDDCAFLEVTSDHYLLVTSDRLPLGLSGQYGGRLVVTQNLSDIISKGGTPIAFLLDVYMPRDATFEDFQDIVLGARREAARYRVPIVGGDTKEGKELTVVGVAIGKVAKPHRVMRSGVQPGDTLALTLARRQRIGTRWAKFVTDHVKAPVSPALAAELQRRYDQDIELPIAEMQAAVATGFVTAAIDNSDGIGGSLEILSRASGVGFAIDRERLTGALDPLVHPVAEALRTDLLRFAFAPGYDWQCLLSIQRDRVDEVVDAVGAVGGELALIGEATAERDIVLCDAGQRIGRLIPFTDEKFKSHAWADQPRQWLSSTVLES